MDNATLDKALSRLTAAWLPLSQIKLHANAGAQGFADLVWAGLAEVKHEPVIRYGITCGEHTFYRLTP